MPTCHLQGSGRVERAEGVSWPQARALHHVVVRPTEEPVLPQRELVSRDQLAAARHAAETLDVVNFGARAHNEVILTEAHVTLGALYTVQPAEKHRALRPPGKTINNRSCSVLFLFCLALFCFHAGNQ